MDLTNLVHLRLEAFEGFRANRLRLVRSVTAVIGISLSMALMPRLEASIVPNKSIKELADKQLTNKQYHCHNRIITLESSWTINAVGNKSGTKRVYGYYQIKSEAAKGASYEQQFWLYWYYVAKRYGVTKYDEPNYCNALSHLRKWNWQ